MDTNDIDKARQRITRAAEARRLLSVSETAEIVDVSRWQIRCWARDGRFPGAYQVVLPGDTRAPVWVIPATALADFRAPTTGRFPDSELAIHLLFGERGERFLAERSS